MGKYRIIGFCDAVHKPRGLECVTMLKPEDQLVLNEVPTVEQMTEYVKLRGYRADGLFIHIAGGQIIKRNPDRCEPVYFSESDDGGFEHRIAKDCDVTDNRVTVGA